MSFELHPDLLRDGIQLGRFPLCLLLLINDRSYPWFVLVPVRENIRDAIDLSNEDYESLCSESKILSRAIMNVFAGEKLNVAALGNVTPQLHMHHVVRFSTDITWPKPIWGSHPMEAYGESEIDTIREKLEAENISGLVIQK